MSDNAILTQRRKDAKETVPTTDNCPLLTAHCPLTMLPTPLQIMRLLDLEPDLWQIEVLESTHARLLLNCCRQAGKSTVVAILGLAEALTHPIRSSSSRAAFARPASSSA